MYKKAWSTHRVVVLPIWTYWLFFPFSLTSASSLLKLANVWGGRCKTKQEGILYAHASIWSVEVPQSCHRGIFCESFTFTTSICSLFSGAAWRMLGATSDKRVLYGIEEFLRWKWVHCSLAFALAWKDSLSLRKTVHQRQDGGWMLLQPNISRTIFEQREKLSVIIFRWTITQT